MNARSTRDRHSLASQALHRNQKRPLETLDKSNVGLQKLLETETVGVMFWDVASGVMIDANDTFLKLTGYTRREVEAGKLSWQKLTPPEYLAASREELVKLSRTGRVGPYEKEYYRKDGSRQWLVFAGSALDGRTAIEFCVDISERKKVEAELRDREAQLRLFAEHAPAAIAMFDKGMRCIVASDHWLSDNRLNREGVYGRSYYELVPDTPARWKQAHQRCLAGAIERKEEDRFERADGSEQWLRWEIRPWFLASREIGGIVIFSEDITERKQAEAALQSSASALKHAQRLAALGSWEWDVHAGRHTWSEEVYRIYGRDPTLPPAAYPEVSQYFTPESWSILSAAVEKSLREGSAYECEAEVVRPDGSHRWIAARGQSSRDDKRKIIKLYGTVQDITERKNSEQRIARLNRAQAILAGVDHAIVHNQARQKLLEAVCQVAVQQGGFRLAWIGMVAHDGSVFPAAKAGEVGYLEGIRVVTQDVPEGQGPVGTAIRENRHVVIADVEDDWRMRPWRQRAHQFGLRWVAAFPLRVANRTVGAFQLYAPRAGFFDNEEIKLLTQVSDDISFALTAMAAVEERQEAEQQLRKSEQELAAFFAESPFGLLWVDPSGRILRVNRAGLELLGYKEAEVCGRAISDFHVEPEVALDVLERLARKEVVQGQRARVRDKTGSIKQIRIDANGLWEKERLSYSRWFMRDVTRQTELEREILTISEREQRRLGHDLHDDLCQQLAGIQFLSQSLTRELTGKGAAQAAQAKEIAQLVQQAMTQTRELARGLSPVSLEAEGLMQGLEQLAEGTSKVFRLDCRFRCDGQVLVPDHTVSIHLYRIAQEAVGNAVKHGRPSRIEIALTAVGKNVRLAVADDGVGISHKPSKTKGMGLRTMQYRAGVIGGSLVVQGLPEGGTGVICTVSDGLLSRKSRK